ncbi:hypothetical protein EOD39_7332 [Acipenser ruthenus]|uniref:Cytochrome c oxidase subunit 7A-related protein, mitochondrial n=1 Tax=Acipenser ruthenus TaxID=7906 RepID=A0A662YXJ5_ACIRT|nr:hypothetical protein EOD39_7332 [Acipenser ruthenus]
MKCPLKCIQNQFLFSSGKLVPGFCLSLSPQRSDGVPVHLKRGVPDKLLYRTTMALTIGGTIYCLVALYMASQPRKR